MENGNADLLSNKPGAEMRDGLRRKSYFGYENEGAFAEREDVVDGLEIDFRFAAARDAVEEVDGEAPGDRSGETIDGGLLVSVEGDGGWGGTGEHVGGVG